MGAPITEQPKIRCKSCGSLSPSDATHCIGCNLRFKKATPPEPTYTPQARPALGGLATCLVVLSFIQVLLGYFDAPLIGNSFHSTLGFLSATAQMVSIFMLLARVPWFKHIYLTSWAIGLFRLIYLLWYFGGSGSVGSLVGVLVGYTIAGALWCLYFYTSKKIHAYVSVPMAKPGPDYNPVSKVTVPEPLSPQLAQTAVQNAPALPQPPADSSPDTPATPPEPKPPKVRYCKHCGTAVLPDTSRCVGCGWRVRVKFTAKAAVSLLAVLLIVSLAANGILATRYIEASSTSQNHQAQYASLQGKYDNMRRERDAVKNEIATVEQDLMWIRQVIAFVIDGKIHYHTYDCASIQDYLSSGKFIALNTAWAESEGYRPCELCH